MYLEKQIPNNKGQGFSRSCLSSRCNTLTQIHRLMGHTGAHPPELSRKLSPYLRDTLRDVK